MKLPPRLAAAVGGLVLLVAAVACRPPAAPSAPLQPDPEVSERQARHFASAAEFNAPPSDELRYGSSFASLRLATGLLKRGERESVARFLDRCAALSAVEATREQMTAAAAAIRAGRMPEFYQYQTMSR